MARTRTSAGRWRWALMLCCAASAAQPHGAAPRHPRPATTDGLTGPGWWPGQNAPRGPVHNWAVCTTPEPGQHVAAGTGFVRAGDDVMLALSLPVDYDHCTEEECPITQVFCLDHGLPTGFQATKPVGWESEGNVGTFGRLVGGQFEAGVPADQVNCFRAPDTTQICRIRVRLDDDQENQPMADDAPWWSEWTPLTVWEFTISSTDAGRPEYNKAYGCTATITPAEDHLGRDMQGTISFELSSSMEPGYCLNTTIEDGDEFLRTGPDDADLRFYNPQGPVTVSASEGEPSRNYDRAVTKEPESTVSVLMLCLDYGAFGSVTAGATGLPAGMPVEITARRAGAPPQPGVFDVRIPLDEDETHIWDGWAEDGPPNDDVDPSPINDPVVVGDNLSRYEEYRGAVIGGNWAEFSPSIKNVFVYNPSALDISVFEQLAIAVLQVADTEFDFAPSSALDDDEDGVVDEDPADGMDNDGDMNYDEDPSNAGWVDADACTMLVNRYSIAHRVASARAVELQDCPSLMGFGFHSGSLSGKAQCAVSIRRIRWYTAPNLADDHTADEPRDSALVRATIAHELGNAISMLDHFGATTRQCVMWDYPTIGHQELLALAAHDPVCSAYCLVDPGCFVRWGLR